jgi:hypothetical protein
MNNGQKRKKKKRKKERKKERKKDESKIKGTVMVPYGFNKTLRNALI